MVYTVAVAAVVNLVLNFALIPPFEGIGAALAMLGSFLVYAGIAFVQAVTEVGRLNWVSMLAAPVLAAAAMSAPLLLLSGIWPVAALAGGVVFFAAYAAVDRVVDPEDLRFVGDLIRRRLPVRRRPAETGAA
jgi:O-antigen/teichoic acid export membrane protein